MVRIALKKTEHPHIVRVEGVCGGEPIIQGTRIPVWLIAGWMKDGYGPEWVQREIYPHLTLAQIYDALSYYHDHPAEIDGALAVNTPPEEELEHRRARWQSRSSS